MFNDKVYVQVNSGLQKDRYLGRLKFNRKVKDKMTDMAHLSQIQSQEETINAQLC